MSTAIGKKAPGLKELGAAAGEKLVVYFYPKDMTSGCTLESQNFRDLYPAFRKAKTRIVGVSRDTLASHVKWKAKMEFPFELIADPDETLCRQFGVMKMKNMYGKKVRGIERSTFVIDGARNLVHEWRGVKVPGHADDVLARVRGLPAKAAARPR